MIEIICGRVEDALYQLDSDSITAVLCDPPYGLGQVRDVAGLLRAWLDGVDDAHLQSNGFMGKAWDVVPSPSVWREVYRVLAPGALCMAFSGCRTVDLMGISMRLAGFDDENMLAWLNGQGFPKATDVSKGIDRAQGADREWHEAFRNGGGDSSNHIRQLKGRKSGVKMLSAPATDLARTWDGWKYGKQALKPAFEPVLLMSKPATGKRLDCIVETGAGAVNVDGARIGIEGGTKRSGQAEYPKLADGREDRSGHWARVGHDIVPTGGGRYPSNVILQHNEDCECVGERRVGSNARTDKSGGCEFFMGGDSRGTTPWGTPDGTETVADWVCSEGCPVAELAAQSGERPSGYRVTPSTNKTTWFGATNGSHIEGERGFADTGTAARYFYQAKSSRGERELGLRGHLPCVKCGQLDSETHMQDGREVRCVRNDHPTVKPLGITEYLARLLLPPEEYRNTATLLVPFCGTGSEIIGAWQAGWRNIIGIEMSEHACEIARWRVAHWCSGRLL